MHVDLEAFERQFDEIEGAGHAGRRNPRPPTPQLGLVGPPRKGTQDRTCIDALMDQLDGLGRGILCCGVATVSTATATSAAVAAAYAFAGRYLLAACEAPFAPFCDCQYSSGGLDILPLP
jgi:hypothetical protein